MLFSPAWRSRPSINCSYKPGTALAGERCSSSNISATASYWYFQFFNQWYFQFFNNFFHFWTNDIEKISTHDNNMHCNPGVSPVQLSNQHCAVNSSGRGEQWIIMKYLWFYWQKWTKMRKGEVNKDEAIVILMTKVNNSIMAKSPMKDLLAWWQSAKLRIHKYDVLVDERGECQRICGDWRSTLFTSWCYQPGEKGVLSVPAELSTSPYQAPAPSPPPSTSSSTSQPPPPLALTIVDYFWTLKTKVWGQVVSWRPNPSI